MPTFKIFARAGILWQTHNAPRLGAALAFYTVLSLAPLLFIAVGVMSLFLSRAEVQQGILEQVALALGPNAEGVVRVLRGLFTTTFRAFHPRTGIIASAIGFVVLLFGASLVLVELRAATNILWGVEPAASKRETILTFLRNRAISVLLVFGIGILLLVTLGLVTYLNESGEYLREHQVPVELLRWLGRAFGFLLLVLFLAVLYKYLPDMRVRWQDVWLGAIVTAVLFALGRWLLGTYLSRSVLSNAYGAAGSLVVFLLWVYYSAQIFFFGVALCRAQRDVRRGRYVLVVPTS